MRVVIGHTTGPHMEGWTFSSTAICCQSISKTQCWKCNFSKSGGFFKVIKHFKKCLNGSAYNLLNARFLLLPELKCLMQDISLFGEKDVHSMGHCPVHLLNINYSSSQNAVDLWFI